MQAKANRVNSGVDHRVSEVLSEEFGVIRRCAPLKV